MLLPVRMAVPLPVKERVPTVLVASDNTPEKVAVLLPRSMVLVLVASTVMSLV